MPDSTKHNSRIHKDPELTYIRYSYIPLFSICVKKLRYARTGVFSCLKINRRVLSPSTGICYNLRLHANAHLRAR